MDLRNSQEVASIAPPHWLDPKSPIPNLTAVGLRRVQEPMDIRVQPQSCWRKLGKVRITLDSLLNDCRAQNWDTFSLLIDDHLSPLHNPAQPVFCVHMNRSCFTCEDQGLGENTGRLEPHSTRQEATAQTATGEGRIQFPVPFSNPLQGNGWLDYLCHLSSPVSLCCRVKSHECIVHMRLWGSQTYKHMNIMKY